MLYTKVTFVFVALMLYIIIIISEWHGEKSLNLIFWEIDRVTNPWYQLFALMVASSSMQSDLTGKYLNSGWNTDPQSLFISIYLLTYLFILTNSLRGSWKTVFDWYRDLNKRALLLNNSVNLRRWINYSPLSNLLRKTHQSRVMCQYVIKLTGYWILLMNVGKATFQSLMLENEMSVCSLNCLVWQLEGFSVLESWKDDRRWNGLNLLWDNQIWLLVATLTATLLKSLELD